MVFPLRECFFSLNIKGDSMDTPVHFAAPFVIKRAGTNVVEQNSPEDVAACVLRICQCPVGYREDLPQFGIPSLEFASVPLQLAGVEEAVKRWEPRALLETTEEAEALQQALRIVHLGVEPE
jgi:phage baseplate assembly protein W